MISVNPGSGTGSRTPIKGFKGLCPTIRRSPIDPTALLTNMKRIGRAPILSSFENAELRQDRGATATPAAALQGLSAVFRLFLLFSWDWPVHAHTRRGPCSRSSAWYRCSADG